MIVAICWLLTVVCAFICGWSASFAVIRMKFETDEREQFWREFSRHFGLSTRNDQSELTTAPEVVSPTQEQI